MIILQKLWADTDRITKWMQVAALVVGAYWAYTRFQLGEAPSLKPNAFVEGMLKEEATYIPGDCYVEFQVSVENVGKVEFDIERVRIRAWRVGLPKSVSSSLTENYFDIDNVQKGKPEFDQIFHEGNLVRHYLPENQAAQTYTWTIKSNPRAVYMLRADVGNAKEFFPDYGRQWRDDICVENKSKTK